MADRTYSLKDLVPILARVGVDSDPLRISRQVRHWTVHGLLSPEQRHTGRGRDRRYGFAELRKAAIYLELAHYGMTVGQLGDIGDWVDMLESENFPLWEFAKTFRYRVFMEVAWAQGGHVGSITVHPDDYANAKRAARTQKGAIQPTSVGWFDPPPDVRSGMYSSVFINLTRLFRALDG